LRTTDGAQIILQIARLAIVRYYRASSSRAGAGAERGTKRQESERVERRVTNFQLRNTVKMSENECPNMQEEEETRGGKPSLFDEKQSALSEEGAAGKPKSELLVFGNVNASLQANFLRFRTQKVRCAKGKLY